jgi:predicted GH43/DUF377 family glycosyl hydrolase
MFTKTRLCFLLFFFVFLSVDAAELARAVKKNLFSDCILDTIQIKIPGYHSVFNPSIISYKDGYLLSFRLREHLPSQHSKPWRVDASFIGLARLDQRFKVLKNSVQLLNIASYDDKFSFYVEDGRLFKVGERIFLIFNDLHPMGAMDGFAMYLAEISEENGVFKPKRSAIPLKYSSAISIEKNWTPFVLENRIFLIYSDSPRTILELDPDTGKCQEIVRTPADDLWPFGKARGGTPACLVEDGFLTFFHTRYVERQPDGKENINYIMGAYLFEPQFPFSIQAITPIPLGHRHFYDADNSKKIVYPCGIAPIGDRMVVTWGKNDNSSYLSIIDKKKLIALIRDLKIE